MSLSQLNLAAVFPGKALAMLELADEQGKVEIYRLYHELLCVGFTAHDPDHGHHCLSRPAQPSRNFDDP